MPDFQDALVRDVMSTPVRTIAPDAPLRDAALEMYRGHVTCLLVDLGDPAQGHGIVTQKDLLNVMADEGADFGGLTVADAMTHPAVSVPPAYNVRTCMLQMRMLGVRRAAVTEGAEVVGVISFTDIFRHAVAAELAP